ncbi:MAG: tRNA (N6-isopentenyl adenosine(37)-C2)-methylthiotransferase MiaB [Phycisphaerae bacterium]|nr:tRNA (N6-isopentenyl adenosine(37)-C2)-methylthiotransferase MiaB [Phycisphaerae bacterium]
MTVLYRRHSGGLFETSGEVQKNQPGVATERLSKRVYRSVSGFRRYAGWSRRVQLKTERAIRTSIESRAGFDTMPDWMIELTVNNGTRGPSVYLRTFGCQMNELDSELVRGHLQALGYHFTDSRENAQVVLFNTCSVREQAENKVWSRLGELGLEKQAGRQVVIGVLGCMAEREGSGLMKRMPQVDLMCGPGELDRLPMLIDNAMHDEVLDHSTRVALQGNRSRRSATLSAAEDGLEQLDLSRSFDPDLAESGGRTAHVRITRGCNKFCTYCVVPHTRGAEVHRPPADIIEECRRLVDKGVVEITLLGQTVNHYMYVHGAAVGPDGSEKPQVGPGLAAFKRPDRGVPGKKVTTFADLLEAIHESVPGVKRLRFVTSYPKDFGNDILEVMRDHPRICRYLHVPAQSGSERILKLMNRGYTVEEYEAFVQRAIEILPDVSIAGDLIVGFPTETEDDFLQTCQLVERLPFKNNFIFRYSPRPGTTAITRYEDDVPEDVKRRRLNELLEIQGRISLDVHNTWVGRTVDVFVEKEGQGSKPGNGTVELGWEQPQIQLSGRTPGDLITVFDLPEGLEVADCLGQIMPVKVESAGPRLLRGKVLSMAREGA